VDAEGKQATVADVAKRVRKSEKLVARAASFLVSAKDVEKCGRSERKRCMVAMQRSGRILGVDGGSSFGGSSSTFALLSGASAIVTPELMPLMEPLRTEIPSRYVFGLLVCGRGLQVRTQMCSVKRVRSEGGVDLLVEHVRNLA
jgi:hypothetical protein